MVGFLWGFLIEVFLWGLWGIYIGIWLNDGDWVLKGWFFKVYEIWYVLTWETDQLYNLTGNPAECNHNKIPLPKIKCYAIVYVNFGWFTSRL